MTTNRSASASVLSVAVFAPLRQTYDYLHHTQHDSDVAGPGCRVQVPFGRGRRVGVIVATRDGVDTDHATLKSPYAILDRQALLSSPMLALAQWAAAYYHHPLGDVIAAMLPTWLRRERAIPEQHTSAWQITDSGRAALAADEVRGQRQRGLLQQLADGGLLSADDFAALDYGWRAVLKRLCAHHWAQTVQLENAPPTRSEPAPSTAISLTAEQSAACDLVNAHLHHFQAIVIHGVTGSGKTEIYLDAIEKTLASGRQALVLVPEIALTQQLVTRFRQRFGSAVAVLHSALSERQRVLTWDDCRRATARVLIGTRSAVWVGLPQLGLIVVDEEHDSSYKQHEGLRYSARDIAIVRAQRDSIPVLLGSATPALETLANVERGKFLTARLEQRAQDAAMPTMRCIDVRGMRLDGGLGEALVTAMREHLARGEQVMLFLNRRGYAPLLMCCNCGELRRCDRCDAYLVYHKQARAARCHHCDRQWPLARPTHCCDNEEVAPIGLGTERLAETVAELFPQQRICRIDRDTVRRPGTFDAMLADIAAHRVDILIGTQMVAKGLDFSEVTLVGIVDADSRLYSIDFRAEERLAQLLIQVAGRAGRARKPGSVLIQTYHPDHVVLRRIIEQGYEAYARVALEERRTVGLPPFAAMAIVRAESVDGGRALEFLGTVRQLLLTAQRDGTEISYPIPALMERRAGRYRALVVIRARTRYDIGHLLTTHITAIEDLARRVRLRWSLDIDPQDTL